MRRVNGEHIKEAGRRLGEAALDPALWPDVMEEICRGIGATGAVLLQGDIRTPDVPRTAGADELIHNYFASGWHLRDVRAERGVPLHLAGVKVVTDQDILRPDELRRDVFYNEGLSPFGFQWFAVIGFRVEQKPWGLSIQRTPREGPFDEHDKALLGSLSAQLTAAATLSVALRRTVVAGVTDALGLVRRPALVLDRMGFVLDANAAAERLFGDDIRIVSRRFYLRDKTAAAELDRMLERLRAAPESADFPATAIAVRRDRDAPVVLRALPVPPAARGPFLGAGVLLTLSPLEPTPGPEPDLIAQAFGLTRAEARLASSIAAGAPPGAVARRLGISRETARNQLKSVFLKTETHRQSELVALLARFQT